MKMATSSPSSVNAARDRPGGLIEIGQAQRRDARDREVDGNAQCDAFTRRRGAHDATTDTTTATASARELDGGSVTLH